MPRVKPFLTDSTTLVRPDHALICCPARAETSEDELLQPLSLVRLCRIDVAFGIGRDAVYANELARLATAIPERRQDLKRLSVEDVHLLVRAIRQIKESLL